jgi:hypothetical protein
LGLRFDGERGGGLYADGCVCNGCVDSNSTQAAGDRDGFGTGNKFITPMIVNGKVYVGTPNGVAVFGLLP